MQWWPIDHEPLHPTDFREQLMASNDDGKVSIFSATADFVPREILRVKRIEGILIKKEFFFINGYIIKKQANPKSLKRAFQGKVPGVKRVNHCLGHDVPISRFAAVFVARRHPDQENVFLVGTEEGCVLRCSVNNPDSYLVNFLAHDGPIYALEFSPFYSGLFLTCGADWFTRVWAYDLIDEPLLSFNSGMACVNAAAWSPRNSTIFATAAENEVKSTL